MNGREIQEFLRRVYSRVDYDMFAQFYRDGNEWINDDTIQREWEKYGKSLFNWLVHLPSSDVDRLMKLVDMEVK